MNRRHMDGQKSYKPRQTFYRWTDVLQISTDVLWIDRRPMDGQTSYGWTDVLQTSTDILQMDRRPMDGQTSYRPPQMSYGWTDVL